jgi:ATP-dependent DNA helicase RecG
MPAKPKFEPRKLMEHAVEVMRQSIPERRRDGKKSPAVGAVLYKPDGKIETAYRGELRDGDHAEFALLERKNRANRLDGSVLFTTLEPCAPGARSFPKLSCAERIVLARIKEVWVGVEDPDPPVDRKGIKYLQDKGVTVHMFDRDLQEAIQTDLKEFIDQALERAAEAEKPKAVVLSEFEGARPATDMSDFSREALERYRSVANIKDPVDSAPFQRRLLQQGLLKDEKERSVPSGFGLLLFGMSPRDVMPQAGLLATIHYPSGKDETRDFDGPLVLVPDQVEKWLNDKLPSTIDRSRMQRQRIPELPFELIREPVVNALVHRDYENAGAKCQLIVTADTIVVKSPGRPIAPITMEQMQNFNAPMLSRNPVLHYVFARMELAEERGMGLRSLRDKTADLGLPIPTFTFDNPYLVLTLYRSKLGVERALAPEVLASLGKSEREGWQWLAAKGSAKSIEYATALRMDERNARRHLNHFVKLGLVRKTGSGPSTEYRLR